MRWFFLAGVAIVIILLDYLPAYLWPDLHILSPASHIVIEVLGATIALLTGTLLYLLAEHRKPASALLWLSGSLIVMGCLDLFHALSPIDSSEQFVGLRTLSTLLAGLLAACAWIPQGSRVLQYLKWVPLAAFLGGGLLGIMIFIAPETLPSMVIPGGNFSTFAEIFNVIGGLGFLAAMFRFEISSDLQDPWLAGICLMLALSGLAFPISTIWSIDWWTWHLIRLIGGLLAAAYLLMLYRAMEKQTLTALQGRETFIQMAAHELRTPLTPLLGHLQIMQRDVAAGKSASEKSLHAALRSTLQIRSLVDGFLSAVGDGMEQITLHCEPLSLPQLTRELVEAYQLISPSHDIVFVHGDEKITVWADPIRLRQAIETLFQNAIRYSPDGGRIELKLEVRANEALLSIRDPGIGIAPSDLGRVFDKFFRGKVPPGIAIPGLGVGLFICQDIVQRHQGYVTVESKEGAGSVFTVHLPLHPPGMVM